MFDAGSIIAKFKVEDSGFTKRIKEAGNSIDGMQSRIDRLQKLVNKSDFGSARFQNLSSALKQAQADMAKMSGRAEATTGTMNALRNAVGAIGIAAFGKSVVDITARFEKYNAVLKNSLGTQEDAAKAMELIQNFASKTPFSVDELIASYIKFINRGLKPTKEELTALGDIASSQGKSFDQLTEAILDATQGEFERLKEFGIRASSAGDQVQLAFKGVNLEVAKTPEAINEALIQLGKMEGVAGSMAAISDTLEGQISNLGDSFDSLQVTLGQALAPIMKTVISILANMIQGTTEFIQNNKELIKQIAQVVAIMVSLVSGFKAFNMIMVGLPAVISSVGRALTVAFGPTSLAITGIALLVTYIINARNELQKFREDAIKTAGQKIAPQDLDSAITKLQAFNREFGNKGVIQATSIDTMNRLNQQIKELSSALQMTESDFRKAFISGGGGAVVVAKTEIAKATEELRKMKNEANSTGEKITTAFKGGQISVGNLKNELQETTNQLQNQDSEWDRLNNNFKNAIASMNLGGSATNAWGAGMEMLGYAAQKVQQFVSNSLSVALENMMQRLQNQMQNIQQRMRILDTFATVMARKLQEEQERELKAAEEQSQKEIEIFKSQEDEKLNALKEAERQKLEALKQSLIAQQSIGNQSLQQRLHELEAEKQAFLQNKRNEFLLEQQQILASVESQKNKQLALQANEQDWLKYLEQINKEYSDKEIEIINDTKSETEIRNAEAKAELERQEAESKAKIEAEEKASNERIQAEEKRQADKLAQIKKRQEEQKREQDKKTALAKYILDVAALEIQKQVARAQATMQLAQGVMSAVSQAPSTFGASLALIPLMYSTYAMSMAAIGSQFVVPPAELFMEDGGVIGGKRHMNGGTRMGSIEAERGELFVNRTRTQELFNWMDNGMSMGGVVVYIQPGAFQGVGDLSDESVEIIGRKIGEQISRRSF